MGWGMRMFRKLVAVLAFGLLPLPALAQDNECFDSATQIIETFYPTARRATASTYMVGARVITVPRDKDLRGDPHVMVCRFWPAYPDRLLVAVPLMRSQPEPQPGYDQQGDLELWVVDPETLAVNSRLLLADFIQEDAVALDAIWFDTAPYKLIDKRVAFGLRREMSGSSRPNPFSFTGLWLFDVHGGEIRPVLNGLQVARSGGEWDTNCAGAFDRTESVLDLSDQRSNGARDIVLLTKQTQSVNTPEGDDCRSTNTISDLAPVTLRYDGQRYVVPSDLLDLYFRE